MFIDLNWCVNMQPETACNTVLLWRNIALPLLQSHDLKMISIYGIKLSVARNIYWSAWLWTVLLCVLLSKLKCQYYIFWFKYFLGKKYYMPKFDMTRVRTWPPDHDSTFHITETPALITRPSMNTQQNKLQCFAVIMCVKTQGINRNTNGNIIIWLVCHLIMDYVINLSVVWWLGLLIDFVLQLPRIHIHGLLHSFTDLFRMFPHSSD